MLRSLDGPFFCQPLTRRKYVLALAVVPGNDEAFDPVDDPEQTTPAARNHQRRNIVGRSKVPIERCST